MPNEKSRAWFAITGGVEIVWPVEPLDPLGGSLVQTTERVQAKGLS